MEASSLISNHTQTKKYINDIINPATPIRKATLNRELLDQTALSMVCLLCSVTFS
uniref:Uncharacterized protein n=1 Tax=Arion vulgaris TaxID=1028688 RepID=A0A0B7AJB7_9EUPU